jgi:hypothetical protein
MKIYVPKKVIRQTPVMVNEVIICTIDRLKTLTITEKSRLRYRYNASPSTATHYLDKFLLSRQLSDNRWIS